jgi:valyl-tRNA synthetase
MPHITEELWEIQGYGDGTPLTRTPIRQESALGGIPASTVEASTRVAKAIYETASTARRLKADNNLASNRGVRLVLVANTTIDEPQLAALANLIGASAVELATATPANAPKMLTALGELAMPLDGLIDAGAERARLGKEIARIEEEINKCIAKLANPSFADRAPPEVVAQIKSRQQEWEDKLATTRKMRDSLPA